MARRITPRAKPVQMRNVLVELPEPAMLALQAKAKGSGVPLHVLVSGVVADWLERAV
jgi:hypothetical protein